MKSTQLEIKGAFRGRPRTRTKAEIAEQNREKAARARKRKRDHLAAVEGLLLKAVTDRPWEKGPLEVQKWLLAASGVLGVDGREAGLPPVLWDSPVDGQYLGAAKARAIRRRGK